METVMSVVNWIGANWREVKDGVELLLAGYVAIMLLVPGDQLESQVKSALAFLRKLGVNR